jgi:hypothetical protein
MLAWAKSGNSNAGRRATWWLKKLWNDSELQSDRNLLPSNRTYNTVIRALAASEGPVSAENLLLDLGEKFRQEQVQELCPNSESFSIVIRSWLQRSETHPDMDERVRSLQRAVEWLRSLREIEDHRELLSTAPELFSGVLRAAKKCSKSRPEVLHLATYTLNDLRKTRYELNFALFNVMLQIGLDALPGTDNDDERLSFVTRLIEDCCDEGLISNSFVRTLATSHCAELTKQYFSQWPLPLSWTRNITNQRYLPRPEDVIRTNTRILAHNIYEY